MRNRMRKYSLILLVATLLGACTSLPKNVIATPRVELRDVQVLGLGFNNQSFLLSFDVSNPNAFPLPVRSIDYGVKLDGKRFASGATESDFTVPAQSAAQFAISVDLNLLQTAPQLLAVVRDSSRGTIPYELEGSLGVNIPLTPPVRYRSSGTIRLSSR